MRSHVASVTLKGHSLFMPGVRPKAIIVPGAPGSGIVFDARSGPIQLNLGTLRANQSAAGARYLYIGAKLPKRRTQPTPDSAEDTDDTFRKAVRVPEHLLSAIFWQQLDDLRIVASREQIPLNGPGIESFYNQLGALSSAPLIKHARVTRSITFEKTVGGFRVLVEASPSTDMTLKIQVVSGRHPDLPNLEEQPFTLDDAYNQAPKHLSARAIARLQSRPKHLAWRVLSRLGYGINNETYLIATPGDDSSSIRSKMQPQYQKEGNEHLAHTAVCDFPGELRAVAPRISGNFVLMNTNHLTRLEAIRFFIREGAIVVE